MKITHIPKKILNKKLRYSELNTYFQVHSSSELLDILSKLEALGLLEFDLRLSENYVNWESAHKSLLNGKNSLNNYDPFGALDRNLHGLVIEEAALKGKRSLSRKEFSQVLRKLPQPLVEKYLLFQLTNVNFDDLDKYLISIGIGAKTIKSNKSYDYLEYRGIVSEGSNVYYLDVNISMSFQEREILRAFLRNPSQTLSWDYFMSDENPDIFTNKPYADPQKNVSKLIYEVHRKLRAAVGTKCIFNKNKEGWMLRIE